MTKTLIRTLTGMLLGASLPAIAQADVVGVYAGISAWNNELGGEINSGHDNLIDLERDLDIDSDTATSAWIAVEQFVPLMPNVRITFTDMAFSGSNTLDKALTFDDVDFAAGEKVSADMDFSHNDVTLYYELLDNVVSLDAGVNFRVFDGMVEIASSNDKASISLDEIVPMLYLSARADLPLSGLHVAASTNLVSIAGNELQDTSASVGYEIAGGFGVEGGYRILRLQLDDINGLDADVDSDGAYVAATLHF